MTPLQKGFHLHAGLEKTGSTTLQRALYEKHSQIFYFGKWLGNQSRHRECLNKQVFEVLQPALWDHEADPLQARKLWEEEVFPKINPDKFLVGSWESFGLHDTYKHVKMLKRLKSVFGTCRILLTIRNPLCLIPSLYLQNLWGHAIVKRKPWMGPKLFINIEDWFERRVKVSRGIHNFLNYTKNIQASIEVLVTTPQLLYQSE